MLQNIQPEKRRALLAAVNAERDRRRRLNDERVACEESLIEFVRGAWGAIEKVPYVEGWHIEAICEHLEAVTRGEIKRLIINIPPRMSKTTLCSVCWPAWTWARSQHGPRSGPQVQFLCASYNQSLSLDISVKMRRLLESRWFQQLWGDRFVLMGDQNTKTRYDNDKGGSRIATSVGGSLLGLGGQVIVVDDPHNTEEVESEKERKAAIDWWDSDMSTTRLNDPKEGAIVLIMQRLHEEDLTGHILSVDPEGWQHLMLPMAYDPSRHCVTSLGWEDPRTEEGELLCPDRIGPVEFERNTRLLGPYLTAGRYQQAPTPRGGGIIRREWWRSWPPAGWPASRRVQYPAFDYVIGSLDTAYTEKEENDFSALTIWAVWRSEEEREAVPRAAIDGSGNLFIPESDRPKLMLVYGWQKRLPLHGPIEDPDIVVARQFCPSCEAAPGTLHERKCPQLLAQRQKDWGIVEWTAHHCRFYQVSTLLIEAKATGITVAQEMQRLHADEPWSVNLINPGKQDKVARAYSVQHLFANGLVYAPTDRVWCEPIVDQCTSFPRAAHDDFVDSTTQALRYLRDTGMIVRRDEADRAHQDQLTAKKKRAKLYDV